MVHKYSNLSFIENLNCICHYYLVIFIYKHEGKHLKLTNFQASNHHTNFVYYELHIVF